MYWKDLFIRQVREEWADGIELTVKTLFTTLYNYDKQKSISVHIKAWQKGRSYEAKEGRFSEYYFFFINEKKNE